MTRSALMFALFSSTAFAGPLADTITIGQFDIRDGSAALTADLGTQMAGMPVVHQSVSREGDRFTLVRQSTDGSRCFTSSVDLDLFGVELVVYTDRISSSSWTTETCAKVQIDLCATDANCTRLVSDEASVRDFLFGSGAELRDVPLGYASRY